MDGKYYYHRYDTRDINSYCSILFHFSSSDTTLLVRLATIILSFYFSGRHGLSLVKSSFRRLVRNWGILVQKHDVAQIEKSIKY